MHSLLSTFIHLHPDWVQGCTSIYILYPYIYLHPLASLFIHFHPLSIIFIPFLCTFINFHPLSSSFILFQPLSPYFILFHPLSSSIISQSVYRVYYFYFSCSPWQTCLFLSIQLNTSIGSKLF